MTSKLMLCLLAKMRQFGVILIKHHRKSTFECTCDKTIASNIAILDSSGRVFTLLAPDRANQWFTRADIFIIKQNKQTYLSASRNAPRSLSVVCFMSLKSFFNGLHV